MAFDFYPVLDRVDTDPDFAADLMMKAVAFRNSVKRSEESPAANGKDVLRENADFLALFKINVDQLVPRPGDM